MHAANIHIANISEAMGHTIEVHLKSYARFKSNATADLVAAVHHPADQPFTQSANALAHQFS